MSFQTLRVLGVMLQRPDSDYYGLELIELARVSAGTLYPVLARLERYAWLESNWENIDPRVTGRSPRRYYRLTDQGKAHAKEVLSEMEQLVNGRTATAWPRS